MAVSDTLKSIASAAPTIKAYHDKISAQIQEGKARLDQLEAKAKQQRAQAELSAINSLKTTKDTLTQRLTDLKKTHESNVTRAKADIDAAVAAFKASVDEIGNRLKK
jgi:F0F1-type ATP synthase membrane subunit b/b'